ncbi:lipoyl(octanoyl) transferase LipB [Blattabacterium cuenoti]|uniref:lipoyl(octanoyl) transferase LipB n=1 Tax=Blattabacterium cuenoti TaxID=1653831 RepID=UPI00163B9F7A|nr:lipoyl(octanoyl) transferase LipB [Blattabacterium cuenoti]
MDQKIIFFEDLGKQEYESTWNYQKTLFYNIIKKKKNHLSSQEVGYLIFVENNHHVYTIGKNGKQEKNLLVSLDFLKHIHANLYQIDRGGDITYHGPGQLLAYPILDLNYFFKDIDKYLRQLEEVIIHFLWKNYGIQGLRKKGYTGVWVNHGKICAIGIRMSRWATMHGLAFNVNTDLQYFNYIIPCGISQNRKVTSLRKEIKNDHISFHEVKQKIKISFQEIFEVQLISRK